MRKTIMTAIAAAMLITGAAAGAEAYDGHWHGGHGGYYHGGYHGWHGGYYHGGYRGPVVVGAYAPYGYYPYPAPIPVAYPVAPVGLSLGFSFR